MQYPPIRKASSELAKRSQRRYKAFVTTHLVCLVLASLLAILSVQISWCKWLVIATVVVAVASFVISIVWKLDSIWFDARALAESVKTSSWRFSMGANPFPVNCDDGGCETFFLDEMAQMIKEVGNIEGRIDCSEDCPMSPTYAMRELRKAPFAERKATYLEERVRDQKKWYSAKSKKNRFKGLCLTGMVIVVDIVALLVVINSSDWSCFLLTLSSSAVAFLQLEQWSQLSHSYGVAARELAHIESLVDNASSDKELSQLVEQAEMAMSREHTLWVSRNAY